MFIRKSKVTIALLVGLGVCVAGFGGLALRLSPRTTAVTGENVPADEDECEEALPPADGTESEA